MKMTGFKFNPAELDAIASSETNGLGPLLERQGDRVADMVKQKITAISYPPSGTRPHPAKRSGRLEESIRRLDAAIDEGRLTCEVIADRDIATSHRPKSGDWYYPEILREELGYDIVTQEDVDTLGRE